MPSFTDPRSGDRTKDRSSLDGAASEAAVPGTRTAGGVAARRAADAGPPPPAAPVVADERPAAPGHPEASAPADRTPRKEDQRSPTIERILACAIELFVKSGYRATTVDMIAERAGLTKGAVYFYFRSKTQLMLRLLDEAEALVVEPAVAVRVEDGGPLDKLVAFLNKQSLIGLRYPQHRLLLILMSLEFSGSNTDVEVRVRAIYRRLYACIEGLIHQGQADGTIRRDVRSHELTSVVMAQHDGTLVEWYRRPGELDGRSLTRAVRLALLSGLETRPAQG